MLNQLLETKRVAQRKTAGTVVSVVLHVVVIGAAVQLSHAAAVALEAPTVVPVHFQPVAPPAAPPPLYTARGSRSGAAGPVTVVFTAPTTVSVEIPPVDLDAAPSDTAAFDSSRPVGTGGDGTDPATSASSGPMTLREVDKAAAAVPGTATPAYPEILKASGVEGEALVRFVVDTVGRAEAGSFVVLEASHEAFGAAVRAALPRMRFLPAESGGRKVRMLVQQRFAFALER
ncbi:MAG: TonB family protein [Gemmatimonadaceae bacterium]|nr:TonB family protein [Gemmatimonadaceae bacterium]